MADFHECSTFEYVRLLGVRFKDYRIRCNLTQKDVSEQSGIGLTTTHKFENGEWYSWQSFVVNIYIAVESCRTD